MKIRKESGLTLIGFLIVLSITLFFAYAGMRLVPMYLEYHALGNAMNLLAEEPGASKLPPSRIKDKVLRSLWASYASNNITKEKMHISKKSNGVNLRVKYEIREPFLGNIDIIGKFDRTVVLGK
ncbi:DUF4845 domain-containing protein [Pseudomonadota bacterium]